MRTTPFLADILGMAMRPISPVFCTWVPPQGQPSGAHTVTTRTGSVGFAPESDAEPHSRSTSSLLCTTCTFTSLPSCTTAGACQSAALFARLLRKGRTYGDQSVALVFELLERALSLVCGNEGALVLDVGRVRKVVALICRWRRQPGVVL